MLCCGRPQADKKDEGGVGKEGYEETEDHFEHGGLTGHSFALSQALEGDGKNDASWNSILETVGRALKSGATSVGTTMSELGDEIAAGVTLSGKEMQSFVSSLTSSSAKENVKVPAKTDSAVTTDSNTSFYNENPRRGIPMLDYRQFPLKGYVDVPKAIVSLLELTNMAYYLIIGRPTMAPSAGLAGYKEVTTKKERANAPFLIVVDKPGLLDTVVDTKYIWVEFLLGDTFMLDVSGMKSMDDYASSLTRKGRWNFKDRQKKFKKSEAIKHEFLELSSEDTAFVEELWPLYSQTGEKNGFTVLTKEEFFKFHASVPDLVVSIAWDVSDPDNHKIISFCTGVTWRDVIMPMWCGTDYENDLNRACSTYFNILYSFVDKAIGDPNVNWVDLGASHRKAKQAIGFSPYPSSGYFRCKNSFMQAFVEAMMSKYYKPERLINDP